MKRSKFIYLFLFSLIIFQACKEEKSKIKEKVSSEKELFFGKIVYASKIENADSVFQLNMEAISPYKIDIYVNKDHFRMIEYGGLSHCNFILDKNAREVWQLDTINKLAYFGEYSDLGDPNAELMDLMPDHYRPLVEITSEKETIAGYACTKYKITRSGFIPSDNEAYIWVADNLRFPSSRYDVQTEINHGAVPAPMIIGYDEGAILRLTVIAKSYTRIFEVVELKKDFFPEGIFSIPAGYQKK